MQVRVFLAILLVFLGILLGGLRSGLSAVLIAVSMALVTPEVYAALLRLYCMGWPLDELFCAPSYCFELSGKEVSAFVGLEVLDCRHGCYDLSEKEFFSLSLSLLHAGFASPEADFLVVIMRRRFFIVVRAREATLEKLRESLCSSLRSLKDALKLVGCSYKVLSDHELLQVLRPEILTRSRTSLAARLLVWAALLLPWLAGALALTPLSLAALLPISTGHARSGYSPRHGRAYTLVGVTSFYTFPSARDMLARARLLYSLLPRTAYCAFLIRPSRLEEEYELDSAAYRTYEFATAFDKLSWMHSSSKLFAAVRRRWERREALYRVSGFIVAEEPTRRLLEKVGLKLSPGLTGLEVLS